MAEQDIEEFNKGRLLFRKSLRAKAALEELDESVIKVTMTKWPTKEDWHEVKRRALKTAGFNKVVNEPDALWENRLLKAKHSPIRYIQFSFDIECPSWVSVHLVRHVHAQPYVQSQRNDRQKNYDRTKAPQDAPVSMIWDMNAEELMNICEKRLCAKASPETREVVERMRDLVIAQCQEFADVLKPACEWRHECYEMDPCGKYGGRG